MSSTAYAADARADADANGGWFYRDVRDVVDGLIRTPARARGGATRDARGGADEFSFRTFAPHILVDETADARSLTTAMGAMGAGDDEDDVVGSVWTSRATKAREAIARAKAAARDAREAAVRLSVGAAATPPHLDASARRREAPSPNAVTSPLGPPRRVVRRTGAPPDLEMPTTTRRRSGDVADSARSVTRENIGRPSQTAREKAVWNVTRERERAAGVSAGAKERRTLSRGAPRASSASEDATLRKLFSIAAKADPAMMRRHAVFGDTVVDGRDRRDRTAKEAVEFLSSPIKRGVRAKPPHPRL